MITRLDGKIFCKLINQISFYVLTFQQMLVYFTVMYQLVDLIGIEKAQTDEVEAA